MSQPTNRRLEGQLDDLFVQYRAACGEPEPSAHFTPGLWARIDARRGWMWHAGKYARRMAVGAAVACALMVGIDFGLRAQAAKPLITQSYVDVLRDADATEDYVYLPVMEVAERF
jgi:hypothetical protein